MAFFVFRVGCENFKSKNFPKKLLFSGRSKFIYKNHLFIKKTLQTSFFLKMRMNMHKKMS